MTRYFLVAALFLCGAAPLRADVSLGGTGEIALIAEDDAIVLSRLELVPELEWSKPDGGLVFVGSGRLRIDASDRVAPDQPPYRTFSDLSRPLTIGEDVTAELRDFYLEFETGSVLWRVGKQQIVWGQLDGFKLLDQVNPQSLDQFILEDFNRSRIGLWSISTEFNLAGTDLQLVYSPDRSTHDIPVPDALFALQAPRFRFGAPLGTPSVPQGPIVREAEAGVFAARLSRYVGGWDLALVGLTGPDHTPIGEMSVDTTGSRRLTQRFTRRTLVGASASTSFSSFVFRGEVGFFPDRDFNTRRAAGLQTVNADQITLAAALDYDAPGGFFFSAQVIYDDVLSSPAGLVRPDNDVYVTLYAQKYFANETIKASARLYAANGVFEDGLVRAELSYQYSDATAFTAGIDVFFGDREGIYGQFGDRDRLLLSIRRYF